MNIVQIDNWQDYLRDGEQFLKTARNSFYKKKKTFTSEAIYNITCMGIEKLIMAFLMKNGDLAENHTMGDLADALEQHLGKLPSLSKKLNHLDTFQDICELDTYEIRIPLESDLVTIVATGDEVQALLTPYFSQTHLPKQTKCK